LPLGGIGTGLGFALCPHGCSKPRPKVLHFHTSVCLPIDPTRKMSP
jgi:hypothetical protein